MVDRTALERVTDEVGGPEVLDRLAGLSGADLTTSPAGSVWRR